MDIARLVKEIRENQGIEIPIPREPQFDDWLKVKLMSRLKIVAETSLPGVLRKKYNRNPYEVALLVQELVSEWYTEHRSGYDSKIT